MLLKRCSAAIARSIAFTAAMLGACVLLLGAYYPPGLSDGTRNPSGALVSGVYPGSDEGACCWLADRAVWKIAPPADAAVAVVTIFIPSYALAPNALQSLVVRIGDAKPATACCYGPGIHQFPVAIPKHASGAVLTVRASTRSSFVPKAAGIGGDSRRLSVLLRGLEFRSVDGSIVLATPAAVGDARAAIVIYLILGLAALVLTRKKPMWGLVAMIVIEPLGYDYPIWHTTVAPFKAALMGTLAGLLFHPAWRAFFRDRRALLLFASILCVAAATALSIVHATYREPVLRETLKALEYALVFVVAYVAMRIKTQETAVRNAFVVATVLVCIGALAQEMIGAHEGTFIAGHAIPRIAGPLEGPNQLAAWLGIVVPVSLAFFSQLRAIGALGVITELLTLSRGGLVGMIAAIVTIFSRSVRAGWIVGVGLVGVVGMLALRFGFHSPPGEVDRYNGGLGTRADLWHAAFAMFRAHPLTGVGAGNYELLLGQYDLLGIRTHANSWYFQSMAEGGVVMLLAIAFVIVATLVAFARARTGFGLAAFAASIGLFVHQTVDDLVFYPKVGAIWWVLLGVAAASLAVRTATPSATPEEDV